MSNTDILTDALLDALTPEVAAVFREEAERFIRVRIADTLQALRAADPDLLVGHAVSRAAVAKAIAPAVAEVTRCSPGRDFTAGFAGELLGIVHPQLLNAVSAAIRTPRRKPKTPPAATSARLAPADAAPRPQPSPAGGKERG